MTGAKRNKATSIQTKVLQAVAHLDETKGSTLRSIVSMVEEKFQNLSSSMRNVDQQVRKVLRKSVEDGILKFQSGRYTLNLVRPAARRSTKRSDARRHATGRLFRHRSHHGSAGSDTTLASMDYEKDSGDAGSSATSFTSRTNSASTKSSNQYKKKKRVRTPYDEDFLTKSDDDQEPIRDIQKKKRSVSSDEEKKSNGNVSEEELPPPKRIRNRKFGNRLMEMNKHLPINENLLESQQAPTEKNVLEPLPQV